MIRGNGSEPYNFKESFEMGLGLSALFIIGYLIVLIFDLVLSLNGNYKNGLLLTFLFIIIANILAHVIKANHYCDEYLHEGDKFCWYCGNKIEEEAET